MSAYLNPSGAPEIRATVVDLHDAEQVEELGAVHAQPDRWIRRTTTMSVALLAGIAAVVSFRHMHELALLHGEDPLAASLIPLAVDGTIVAASMSLLLASRYGARGGILPWALLVVSSLASLGANIAVAEPTAIARLIAGWPSLALIGAYEMLMSQVRQAPRASDAGIRMGHHASSDVEVDRSAGGDRALQRTAWQWARTISAEEGKTPSGSAISQQFERSARWGRMVKRAGLAGELD